MHREWICCVTTAWIKHITHRKFTKFWLLHKAMVRRLLHSSIRISQEMDGASEKSCSKPPVSKVFSGLFAQTINAWPFPSAVALLFLPPHRLFSFLPSSPLLLHCTSLSPGNTCFFAHSLHTGKDPESRSCVVSKSWHGVSIYQTFAKWVFLDLTPLTHSHPIYREAKTHWGWKEFCSDFLFSFILAKSSSIQTKASVRSLHSNSPACSWLTDREELLMPTLHDSQERSPGGSH